MGKGLYDENTILYNNGFGDMSSLNPNKSELYTSPIDPAKVSPVFRDNLGLETGLAPYSDVFHVGDYDINTLAEPLVTSTNSVVATMASHLAEAQAAVAQIKALDELDAKAAEKENSSTPSTKTYAETKNY